MKKTQIRGIVVLAAVLAAYLVLALVIPFNRSPGFWLGFTFGIIAIVVSAAGFIIAFKSSETVKSKFYGFPIAVIACIYLIAQLVVSFILMGVGFMIPMWIGLIICVLLFIAAVIGLVAADVSRDEIERIDEAQKVDTENMIALRSKAGALVGLCKDDETKKLIQKLSDEFRFGDPVSNYAVKGIESELDVMLGEIQKAVLDGNGEAVADLCGRAGAQLTERNRLCKLNK